MGDLVKIEFAYNKKEIASLSNVLLYGLVEAQRERHVSAQKHFSCNIFVIILKLLTFVIFLSQVGGWKEHSMQHNF